MPAEKRCMFNCSYYNITSSSGSRCSISFFPQSHFLSSFLSHVGAPFYFCLFHFHSITYTARHPNGDASKHAVSQMETLFFLSSWYLIWLFRVFFFVIHLFFSLFFFVLLCDFWCRIIMFISMNMQTDGQRKIWFSYGGPAIQCKSPTISSCHDSLSRNLKRIRVTARPIQVSSIGQARCFQKILDNHIKIDTEYKKSLLLWERCVL